MTDRDRFRTLVADLAAKAKASLPENAGRIDAAVALVLAGDVVLQPNGTALVGSAAQPMHTYSVNGACECPDAPRAPQGYCKHRLGKAILIRAERALRTREEVDEAHAVNPLDSDDENDAIESEEPHVDLGTPGEPDTTSTVGQGKNGVSAPEGMADLLKPFLVYIKQRPFIRYAGLLKAAHAQGLCKLETTFVTVTAELALAQCTATFQNGRVFTDVADSSPNNVGAQVKAHWIRLSATRAAARALRNALGIDSCSVEELMTDE